MSQRFGRNQRRRAREALASTQRALDMANGLSNWQGARLRSLQTEIDEAKQMVGPFSALFAPQASHVGGPEMQRVSVDNLGPAADYDYSAPLKAQLQSVPLDVLLVSVNADLFKEMLHADVVFAGERVAYSISRMALSSMPRERFVREASRSIAMHLDRELRKRGITR